MTRGRPRVVFFSTGHSEVGGGARRSDLLSSGLAGRGWDVRVVCRAPTLTRPRVIRRPGLVVVEVPGFNHRLGGPLFLLCAVVLGLAWGRRACFVSFQLGSQALAAGLCAIVKRRPFVALSTSNGSEGEVTKIARSPGRWPHRLLLRRAARLVGQTEEAGRELTALARDSPERVAIIPNPVAARPAAPLDGRPRAVYTGRLAEEKGLDTLLAAWVTVAANRPGALLTLVGEGGRFRSVEADLRASVAADPVLRATVRFTGWVEDVQPFLLDADVFVLPSHWEGMSNSLLEACMCRRLPVVSDIPGNLAVVGDGHSLLVPPGDASALAIALTRAFDDDAIRRRTVQRVERRIELFRLERVLDLHEDLLVRLLGGRPSPAQTTDPPRGRSRTVSSAANRR